MCCDPRDSPCQVGRSKAGQQAVDQHFVRDCPQPGPQPAGTHAQRLLVRVME